MTLTASTLTDHEFRVEVYRLLGLPFTVDLDTDEPVVLDQAA